METAEVNAALCDGCGKCSEICCVEAIELIDGKAVIGPDCILCMACAAVCQQEAITLPELPRRPRRMPRPQPAPLAQPSLDRTTGDDGPSGNDIGSWIGRLRRVAPTEDEPGGGQRRHRGRGHGKGRGRGFGRWIP